MTPRLKEPMNPYNANVSAEDLAAVMADHPTLCDFGFNTGYFHQNGIWGPRLSKEELAEKLAESRQSLLNSLKECSDACRWLLGVDTIKSINPWSGSYGLKHVAEHAQGTYISNGAFIAAAILMGFRFKVSGPNARFNMSQRSLKARRRVLR